MATTHWLHTQIVIDSTNKNLYFSAKYLGAYVDYTASITEATYANIFALIYAVGTAMASADTGGNATYTWEQSGADGKLSVVAAGTNLSGIKLRCTTTTNSIWSILGFSTGSILEDATGPTYSLSSTYQADHCWYMTRGPSSDTYDRPRIVGSELVVASSGIAERVTWSDQTTREMQWTVVPIAKYLTRFAATNEAFEDVWEDMAHGYYVSYYTYDSATLTFTLEGKYALECESTAALDGARVAPGAAYYSTPVLKLVRQS